MTSDDRPLSAAGRPRTEIDLALQQLAAVDAFTASLRTADRALAAANRSRETRMDAARRMEVLRRQHDAVVARSHEQLRRTGELLRGTLAPRVLLAHRNAWFADKLAHVLQDRGVQVVARTDNGADAVGLTVAEQPDLLLVEDTLAMVPGEQVVAEVTRLSPGVLVTAQVAYGDRVGALLNAGAVTVFTRQVPPADVARALDDLVRV